MAIGKPKRRTKGEIPTQASDLMGDVQQKKVSFTTLISKQLRKELKMICNIEDWDYEDILVKFKDQYAKDNPDVKL